ncbi:MAG TPA: hypothetical protein VHA77_05050 [Xanthobacteraceae bacterium]|nr:hypothetical protein [Xanthobacteraceae bacterium]
MLDKSKQSLMLRHHLVDLQNAAQSGQMVSGSRHVMFPGSPSSAVKLTQSHEFVEQKENIAKLLRDVFDETPAAAPPQPRLLDRITIDTGAIVFDNGVPVGGWAHVDLFPNGAFSFSGHFHDSGAPSYNVTFAVAIRGSRGTTFTLAKEGRMHGTFEAGSRDFNWGDNGSNPALQTAWAELSAGYNYQWNAAVNIDIGPMVDAALRAIGAVGPIVGIIALIA